MQTIGKFTIPIEDECFVNLPEGAEILSVQTQKDHALANLDKGVIWAVIDTDAPMVRTKFRVFGTGNPFPVNNNHLEYIGTFQLMDGRLVWHLFLDHADG